MNAPATIGLVDDEPGMLKAVGRLLRRKDFVVCPFSSAEDFLRGLTEQRLDCAVLDVAMPGLSGLELQDYLKREGIILPIVFLTGEGDIPMSVRAIKAGAVNFLTKPVDQQELLDALRVAVFEGAQHRAENAQLAELRARVGQLTSREFQVLRHVIAGRLNKQIAADLGIVEQTIKVHRMRITEKLGIVSVVGLVRAAERLQISPAD